MRVRNLIIFAIALLTLVDWSWSTTHGKAPKTISGTYRFSYQVSLLRNEFLSKQLRMAKERPKVSHLMGTFLVTQLLEKGNHLFLAPWLKSLLMANHLIAIIKPGIKAKQCI